MSLGRKITLVVLTLFISALSLFMLWVSSNYEVPIMMYHHVSGPPHHGADTVSPELFEKQMKFLFQKGYTVISLDEYVKALQIKDKISRNTVVITFDDGYDDNYTNALPILEKYKFPATVFVSSDIIAKDWRMNWDQIKKMSDAGIMIGSHGVGHRDLPSLPRDLQEFEIGKSKEILEAQLGKPVEFFAYPGGRYTKELEEIVKEYGYKAALTTKHGDFLSKEPDLYALKRIRFSGHDDSEFVMWAKLSGYYYVMKKFKANYNHFFRSDIFKDESTLSDPKDY